MVWLAVPLSLILLQPNLGTASILGLLAIVSLVVSGVSTRKLALLSCIGLLMLPVLWTIMRPYQRERIYTFINPSSDPYGSGYNALQAQIAIGSGQLFGRGLGQGTQSHLRFLPERYSDFIYSSLVEELGFIGGSITIGVFIALVLVLVVASKHTDSDIASLILLLSSSLILIQAFINIGMNVGILPITGITLPLMSAGGSSLLSTAVILGMCVGITQQISVRKPKLELH
jgi:rod shape determining protein RodA